MNQEKSVHFSVIKQKIIKTDEILGMYLETNNKLKNVQHTCKDIKLKYDQTVLNLSRIQLENERCTFSLESLKLKYSLLENENEKLREQKLTLEDKYNQQTVQSQLNIQELENQLRMFQEIKTSSENLTSKKKRSSFTMNENEKKIKELEERIKELEESEVNSKNEILSLNVRNEKLSNDVIIIEKYSDDIKKLQIENCNLLEELNKFKSQVNIGSNIDINSERDKEKNKEISELQDKILVLIDDKNRLEKIEEETKELKQQLKDQEVILLNSKIRNPTKDICLQTDQLTKKHTRTIRVQTLESMKSFPLQEIITSENRELKQTILDCEAEIFKLKAKPKISKKHHYTQTEELENEVESVEYILKEMSMPRRMLSPMSTSRDNLSLDDTFSSMSGDINDSLSVLTDIPDIVITPPTPIMEKNFEKFTDSHKTTYEPPNNEIIKEEEQFGITNIANSKNSSQLKNKKALENNLKKLPGRKKYISPFINNEFIKLRKNCLKRMLNKRYVLKKEVKRRRKLSRKDCILKALETLKRSNINFTISNESNVPKWWTNYESFKYPEVIPNFKRISDPTQEYKTTKYATEMLNCSFKNCNNGNSCMLLNNTLSDTELLGFFSVKNENITPSCSRMGSILDRKPLNLTKLSNPKLNSGSKLTSENLLEMLADLVSQKLKEKENNSKRKQKSTLDKFDSFYSETETEIERLFETPNDNVLKRNKMLLKRAKQQNLNKSVFSPSFEDEIKNKKCADNKMPVESENSPETTLPEFTHVPDETLRCEIETSSLGLDLWIKNKNASNFTKLIPKNRCDTFKYSTGPSETIKETFKLPSTQSVKMSLCDDLESTNQEKKLDNDHNKKVVTASAKSTVFNDNTDSSDSFQFPTCPPLLSPLSSVTSKDSPGSNSGYRSQTEEKWSNKNEKMLMEITPLTSRRLIFSNDCVNASKSDNSFIVSPISSACINKYLYNEKIMSEEICTFLKNFEGNKRLIEDIPVSPRKLPASVKIGTTSERSNNSFNMQETTEKSEKNDIEQEVNQNIYPIKNPANEALVNTNMFVEENSKFQSLYDTNKKQSFSSFSHRQFSESTIPPQCGLSSSPIKSRTKEILDLLPDEENTPNCLSEINEIGDIPICPTSPINDWQENVNSKSPKIIPLERLDELDNRYDLDKSSTNDVLICDPPNQEQAIGASKSKFVSFNNNRKEHMENFPLDIDVVPRENVTSSDLLKTNEIVNIANCSMLPTTLLDKSDDQDGSGNTEDISICSKLLESNNEAIIECCIHKPIITPNDNQRDYLDSVTSDVTNSKNCQITKCLKMPASPMTLRRSKRNCIKTRKSEILKDGSNGCATNGINEQLVGNLKSKDLSKIPKVKPDSYGKHKHFNKSSSNNSSSMISKILDPIKRKRGRPRKHPFVENKYEETESSSVGVGYNEEPVQPRKIYREEHIENAVLTMEHTQLTSKENEDVKELSYEENSTTCLAIERVEEVMESKNMFFDKGDLKLKTDIKKKFSDIISIGIYTDILNDKALDVTEKKTNNLCETNTWHTELLIPEYNFKEAIDKYKAEEILCKKNTTVNELRDPLFIETNSGEVCNAREKPLKTKSTRKRKNISKLKSNILRQIREKRKMLLMDVEIVNEPSVCDLNLKIDHKSGRSNVEIKESNINVSLNSKSSTNGMESILEETNVDNSNNKYNGKKIHIVQNIMIPANSSCAVDLLEKKDCAHSKFPSDCDIRLNATQTSSQSNGKFLDASIQKTKIKNNKNDNSIPAKKKRIVPAKSKKNSNGDILSKIMGEMDKERNNTVKSAPANIPKPVIANSIEDKEWRKGFITIAERINNVSAEEKNIEQTNNNGRDIFKNRKRRPSTKERILMSRLLKLSTEENIPDEIVLEFKRKKVEYIAEIILQWVSQDIYDKPDDKYYPAPLMTKTQRVLLRLMVQLEKENVHNLLDKFLSKSETLLFRIGCGIRPMIPITRLYMAVCRLQANVDKMRKFCYDAFFFIGDLAIPLLFTVLTSWIEVFPKEADLKNYPLAKVLVQVVHLKGCNQPGYNLLPLRLLLHQYHGYPKERWDCDELFKELFQQYLRNPDKSSDLALRLLCKNKDSKWIYQKINEFFKPLIYKIPATNVNFKATAIILIGNICRLFKPKNEFDETCLIDLRRWLIGLTEEEEVSNLITQSVHLSLSGLPRKKKPKGNPSNRKKIINKVKNMKNKKTNDVRENSEPQKQL